MMGNRKLPFGYRMQLGDIIYHPEECKYVRLIFDEYQNGASLKKVADMLEKEGIPYDEGRLWNKNIVARIIENKRYTGQGPYPAIVTREQFDAVTQKRAMKRFSTNNSPIIKILRRLCGSNITDDILCQVLYMLSILQERPELVQIPMESRFGNKGTAFLQKELDDAFAQQPVDEELARRLIRELASAEYAAIGSAKYETERIQRFLLAVDLAEEQNEIILQKCVAKVMVSNNRVVSLRLKNGQIIERSVLP